MSNCAASSAHRSHIALNGECPWCGVVDESGLREDLSVEQIERMYG